VAAPPALAGAGGAAREEVFERVLVAAGRRPNLAGLGLESTGLALDAKRACRHRSGDDAVRRRADLRRRRREGHLPLLHEAADEGRIAGANAMLWPDVERRERRLPLAIAFTDPQMALVGAAPCRPAAGQHAIGAVSFENQGRARVTGRNRGLVRIYGDSQLPLLGAEMFGPGMEHMAHLLAWAVQQRDDGARRRCRCRSITRCWRKAALRPARPRRQPAGAGAVPAGGSGPHSSRSAASQSSRSRPTPQPRPSKSS
jgi:hypothetical protein